MTKIDTSTEAVERLLDGVTPGPWAAEGEDQGAAWGMAWSVCRADNLLNCVADGVDTEANVRFIAAARDLVPALLKERDDLRDSLAEAVQVLKTINARSACGSSRAVSLAALNKIKGTDQ